MKRHLSADTYKKLQAFVSNANKQGPLHPLDQDRWRDFLIAAHNEQANLAAEELEAWFNEQGFPEDVATELVIEYEQARNLLKQYDKGGPLYP